ncbi:LysR family transcriptional regulator [Cupriavidus pampae]|uniref:HTH-type transcriptional regulator HdfR n=1 Tax=Cupriavidus pampae TaxID=659251 RepID=A0ABN7Y915_9BURK|nr:LysR family transcriptional regulator [Cupriavidus pampae]CAG9169880.1 HTH-type transcriptional regulator HdfR [Cupriavidus pampae]
MFDWNDMRHFIALAEAGTLSGAARRMEVEHATVARRVAALEHALGIVLVNRSARRWHLTEAGRDIASVAEGMQTQAHALERAVLARRQGRSARVTVSAPPAFASIFLAPRLAVFGARHPEIDLTLHGTQALASLHRQEADIAIRIGRPTELDYVARRIGQISYGLYAAPGYTALPADQWQFIAYDVSFDHMPEQKWIYEMAAGRRIGFRSNDLMSQLAAARGGMGVAALPRYLAGMTAGVDAGDGVAVVPGEVRTLARDFYLVVHADMRRQTAIRAVMDFIADVFAREFPG